MLDVNILDGRHGVNQGKLFSYAPLPVTFTAVCVAFEGCDA